MKIEEAVDHALQGNSLLTREAIINVSVPGTDEIQKDAGELIHLDLGYVLGKASKAGFAGLGADIYGKSFDKCYCFSGSQ